MKSTTPLAAATLAAAMLAGVATAAEPPLPETVSEAKTRFEAHNIDRLFPESPRYPYPPANVRGESLRELLAGTVSVSRDTGFYEPVRDLQIAYTGHEGQAVTCQLAGKFGAQMFRRWSWAPGRERAEDGTVRPIVLRQPRTAGPREGLWSLLHDGETGEVVWHVRDPGVFGGTFSSSWVQRHSGHLQERLPAATWTLCPDFPSAEELGVGVNHAQTATSYDRLVAQDPGRRIRRPGLVSEDVAEKGVSLSTWAQAIVDGLADADGRALAGWTGWPDTRTFVFYAPLAAVWTFDARDPDGAAGERARSVNALSGHGITSAGGGVVWHGWPALFPRYDMATERHPLAVQHDRLIGGTLAREIAGLPAGARFEASGAVTYPDDADRESAWKCGAAGSVPELEPATWRSHGGVIEIVPSGRSSGARVWLDDLVAALEDDGMRKPQAELTASDEIECLRSALGRARARIRELAANLEEVKAENALLEALLKEAMKQ